MNFDWHNPYPTTRIPLLANNIVSTSHPLAAQAGLRLLLAGGNAIDAAIAAAAALTIVEPVSCGLGSDAFALVWDGKELHGLNGSGTSPAAWTPDYFAKKYGTDGNGLALRPVRGWDSVTVPGAIASWQALHQRFGHKSFADVLAPAIELAERGAAVPPIVAKKWAAAVAELAEQPGFKQTFMPQGRAPLIGEKFQFAAAAKSLRLIARDGAAAFYQGEIAEQLVKHAREHNGAMTLNDLRDFQPEWVTPLTKNYRGYDVHEIPPNGQGIAALIALGILNEFDLASLPVDSVDSQHLQIEAMKLAFADVYRYVADPKTMEVTPEQMLDQAYLRERAKTIQLDRAQDFDFGLPKAGGTVYLTAADQNGMMVSFIQSNYMGFGSGIAIPEYGVSLQNRGAGFSSDPKSANVVAPNKRPFHTIIPGFVTKDGVPQLSFGVMGGDMQPQGHVQTLVRMLDYQQQPQAACDAPRWKVNRDFSVDLEGIMNNELVAGLGARGQRFKSVADSYMDFGSGQFIWRNEDGGYIAASDARRDGQAVGF